LVPPSFERAVAGFIYAIQNACSLDAYAVLERKDQVAGLDTPDFDA
jgi:hypothetical protein